jgi:hypothetical protein
MKELLTKLQIAHRRSHSHPTSVRSQMGPELETVQPSFLGIHPSDEDQAPTPLTREARHLIGSSVVPDQALAHMSSATLKHDMEMATQCLGLLYKANVDPLAIVEAVS